MKDNKNKNLTLQGLRAFAFFGIFISHTNLFGSGVIGVSVFIILSGFLMAVSYSKKGCDLQTDIKSSFGFSIKKMSKLYPLHALTFAAMFLFNLLLLYKNSFPTLETRDFIVAAPLNLIMLQSWLPFENLYFSFNKVSWYLSVSMFSYFCFPIIFRSIKKRLSSATDNKEILFVFLIRGAICLLSQLIVSLVAVLLSDNVFNTGFFKWATYICPLYRIGDFYLGVLMGMCVCFWKRSENKSLCSAFWSCMELLWISAVAVQLIIYVRQLVPRVMVYDIYWISTSLTGIFLFYMQKGIVSKMLRLKPFVFIGNISAQTFLTHQIIIGFCGKAVHNVWILTFVSFIVTVLATLIWVRLEKFVLERKSKHSAVQN